MVKDYEKIRDSLLNQLSQQKARVPHFEALVDDAIFLVKMIDNMRAEIEEKGITYIAYSSVGKEYEKDNPCVKLLPNYERQLQSLLKDLKCTTDTVSTDSESEDDYL